MDEAQQQVVKWLATGRVGLSSKCMAMWLAFGERTMGCFLSNFIWQQINTHSPAMPDNAGVDHE